MPTMMEVMASHLNLSFSYILDNNDPFRSVCTFLIFLKQNIETVCVFWRVNFGTKTQVIYLMQPIYSKNFGGKKHTFLNGDLRAILRKS